VTKLRRNLAAAREEVPGSTEGGEISRKLTSVLFGKRSPTVVVGDKRGVVTMYRIYEPVAVLQEGPKQQTARLQRAVLSQTDPAEVSRMAEKGYVYDLSVDTPPPAPVAAAAAAPATEEGADGEAVEGDAAAESAASAAVGESTADGAEVTPPIAAE
jgi:hypothetical protein